SASRRYCGSKPAKRGSLDFGRSGKRGIFSAPLHTCREGITAVATFRTKKERRHGVSGAAPAVARQKDRLAIRRSIRGQRADFRTGPTRYKTGLSDHVGSASP